MRKEGLENLAIAGKLQGTKVRGRPRMKFLKSLAAVTNTTEEQLLRKTRDRKLWRDMTANVLEGHGI